MNAPDFVLISGKDGCVIKIMPIIVWAWQGRSFYFKSDETEDSINACFAPSTILTESRSPTIAPAELPTKAPVLPPTEAKKPPPCKNDKKFKFKGKTCNKIKKMKKKKRKKFCKKKKKKKEKVSSYCPKACNTCP